MSIFYLYFYFTAFNALTGSLPNEIGLLPSLKIFWGCKCQLGFSILILKQIGKCSNIISHYSIFLFVLYLIYIIIFIANNIFTGTIPSEIGLLTELPELWLRTYIWTLLISCNVYFQSKY